MSARFQELDWVPTPLGAISLRRRWDPVVERDVYEIKLDDDFLMSSLFTAGEVELTRRSLDTVPGTGLDVVVGGLGLGHSALTALEYPNVGSLLVVEALEEVIRWHERGLIPAGSTLSADPRVRLLHGDFFARVADPSGIDPDRPGQQFDAVLVDIDHSPRHLLHAGHAPFYEPEGLQRLARLLRPGGVFGLWSNDPPDAEFTADLRQVFEDVSAEIVSFPNHYQGGEATNTVYVARA
ncbi:hypothetical protein CLV30_10435 [Haloactinopolyspora alba]|uniref:Spermidine synthase n=1 Tax=Haloactinopolyspora alba TaxID=648780 RepID=A0A2P8E6Q9_9ACTN|nr:spermidine synthase [Haloactinopolyspora alba]PSL05172.1 hypothetical protein CLV30_10435 [Haloactinopolyspora alba]